MRNHEINKSIAAVTGESVRTIRQRGFNIVDMHAHDPESMIVDWDAIDSRHGSLSMYPIHWLRNHRS